MRFSWVYPSGLVATSHRVARFTRLGFSGVVVLACFAGATASAGAASLSVRGKPVLEPKFRRGTSDYVTRCAKTGKLRLRFVAKDGYRVGVQGTERSGSFGTSFKLESGQAIRFSVLRRGRSRTYVVRCLPPDFPTFESKRQGTPQAEWFVVTPNYPTFGHSAEGRFAVVFDNHGAPLWWRGGPEGREIDDAKLLPNGNLAWSNNLIGYYGASPTNRFEEHRLGGSLVRTYRTVGSPTDFHELETVPGTDNHMLITYRRREHEDMTSCGGEGAPSDFPVADGEIQELDASGDVVWTWNTHSDGHISVDETGRYCPYTWSFAEALGDVADNVHANSVEAFTEHGREKVLLSAARLDAIYQIDKQTKRIDWKLGGTTTDHSLTVVGDDAYAPWHFGGQHDARHLRDGTITLHDNQTADARPPRAVRFRIDEAARTATRVESLTDPAAPLSFCCGSARKLRGGNWVMAWGYLPLVTEMKPNGKRVFRLDFGDVYTYRADPIERGRLSRAALRRGMDRMYPR
jgi:hypothetical protein